LEQSADWEYEGTSLLLNLPNIDKHTPEYFTDAPCLHLYHFGRDKQGKRIVIVLKETEMEWCFSSEETIDSIIKVDLVDEMNHLINEANLSTETKPLGDVQTPVEVNRVDTENPVDAVVTRVA
jgi:hypothetical protein